jgi:hypothetical protein
MLLVTKYNRLGKFSRVWWYTPTVPALEKKGKRIVSSRSTWARIYLKKEKWKKERSFFGL